MKSMLVLAAIAIIPTAAFGAEKALVWPQFRGPQGSGVAEHENPPVEFGLDKNVKWKIAVPSGLSSPIVAGDNLVITAFDDGKLYTIAYRRADGSEVWRAEAPAQQIETFHKIEGSPATSTPATDGKRIISYFGSCGLICYDLTGREHWRFDLPPAATAGDFGSGVSPIAADGVVVLVRDETKDPKILAIDAATGLLQWEKKRQSITSYCTPVVWSTPDGKQVVAAGHARMSGYDLKTGDEKWFLAGTPSLCAPSPVAADGALFFAGWSPGGPDDAESPIPDFDNFLKQMDANGDGVVSREEARNTDFNDFFDNNDANKDGKITRDEWDAVLKFISEGTNSAFALKAGGTGDVSESHLLWKQTKGLPYLASAIVYRGQYVMVKDGGIVTAYDAKKGNEMYQARVAAAGKDYASPVAANGRLYFLSLDGVVTVLKAGEEKPVVIAKDIQLGERTAATPAIADDTLYVRTEKHLYAFGDEE
jgi:outer membrane protein assembly factor BamB